MQKPTFPVPQYHYFSVPHVGNLGLIGQCRWASHLDRAEVPVANQCVERSGVLCKNPSTATYRRSSQRGAAGCDGNPSFAHAELSSEQYFLIPLEKLDLPVSAEAAECLEMWEKTFLL